MKIETMFSNVPKEFGINLQPKEICIYCNGTGQLKQMERVAYFNGGGISKDSKQTVPCNVCNGTGGR